jgi:RNA polymerase sigma factor (sigma-70 family)
MGDDRAGGRRDRRLVKVRPAAQASTRRDQELLAAIANGDLDALGEFFERYEPTVKRYLGHLGIGSNDADDLVQATFLEVVPAASRFDPKYAARSWLFGITTVMVRRHRRSVRRQVARVAAWARFVRRDPEPTPVDLFERDDAARRLTHALERMSPKKREVLVLVTMEGMSGEETANALGIPVKTVWTRLHYARLDLLDALREEDR